MRIDPNVPKRLRSSLEALESRIAPAVIFVTNVKDSGAGSLRDAIADANDQEGVDDIVFKTKGKLVLKSELDALTESVNFDGPGAAKLSISGGNKYGVFKIGDEFGGEIDVTFEGLKITGGKAAFGGGIYINTSGTVKLDGVVVSDNVAVGTPIQEDGTEPQGARGGGIYLENGNLLLTNASSVTKNKAASAAAQSAAGGGIFNAGSGSIELNKSTVSGNVAAGGAGTAAFTIIDEQVGDEMSFPAYAGGRASGGGISTVGDLTIKNGSSITGNSAVGGAGASGATGKRGSFGYAGENGSDAAAGGSAYGGGISSTGTLIIEKSTVSGNKATAGNGGNGGVGGQGGNGSPYVPPKDEYGYGIDGIIRGNAGNGGSGADGGDAVGGGIHHDGLIDIQESTISGNTATAGNAGRAGAAGKLGSYTKAPKDFYGEGGEAQPGTVGSNGVAGKAVGGGVALSAQLEEPVEYAQIINDGYDEYLTSSTITKSVISNNAVRGGSGVAGFAGGNGAAGASFRVTGANGEAGGDGEAGTAGGEGGSALGGGIFAGAALEIRVSTISGNTVTGGNGAAGGAGGDGGKGGNGGTSKYQGETTTYYRGEGGAGGEGGYGGQGGSGRGAGIYTVLDLNMQSSTISGNTAKLGKAGADGATGKKGAAGSGPKYDDGSGGGGYEYAPRDEYGGDGYGEYNYSIPTTAEGGGIFVGGGTLTATQVTVANNTADLGGGISVATDVTATISHSTIASNSAKLGGGLFVPGGEDPEYAPTESTVTVISSIIAANKVSNKSALSADVSGAINADYSLFSKIPSILFEITEDSNLVGEAKLGKLSANGAAAGTPFTMSLGNGSKAINAGLTVDDDLPEFDARGKKRLLGSRTDIGAVEVA